GCCRSSPPRGRARRRAQCGYRAEPRRPADPHPPAGTTGAGADAQAGRGAAGGVPRPTAESATTPAIELKPRPHPPAAPVHVQPRPDAVPPVVTPSVEGTQPMPTVAPPSATPAGTAMPVEATLAYRSAPLQFPVQALRQHLQGTVLLRVLVDENGAPVQVEVEHGSGYAVLDRSAREQVLARWRFQPAMVNGHAVRAWARVPVSFVLHDL